VRLAGGLVIALAVAASLAGSGLAIAAGIAVLLALLAALVPDPYGRPAWDREWVGPPWAEKRIRRVRMVALLPLNGSAIWISAPIRMMVLGLLIVGTVVLAGFSFGHSPGNTPPGEPKPWWAIALAALVLFPLLVPKPGALLWGRFIVSTLLGVALGISTVHQLGTGLSFTFLKDLLVAAQGASLGTVLVVFVGIATVTAAIDTVADAELEFLDWEEWVAILATIALAVFAGPVVLLITAGVATLGYTAFRVYIEQVG
jgi:hypothetical protein